MTLTDLEHQRLFSQIDFDNMNWQLTEEMTWHHASRPSIRDKICKGFKLDKMAHTHTQERRVVLNTTGAICNLSLAHLCSV